MGFDNLTEELGRALSQQLEEYEQDREERRTRAQKGLRLDNGMLVAYVIGLAVVLLQFLPEHRTWGGADWIVQIHLLIMLASALVIHLSMMGRTQEIHAEVGALAFLRGETMRLCAACRRALRDNGYVEGQIGAREAACIREIDALARLCGEGEEQYQEAVFPARLRTWHALALLGVSYVAFLIPCFAEDLCWDVVNWLYALLMTTIAVLLLFFQITLLLDKWEREAQRGKLERCRAAISRTAEKLCAAQSASRSVDGDITKVFRISSDSLSRLGDESSCAFLYGPQGAGKTEMLRRFLACKGKENPTAAFWWASVEPAAFEGSERIERRFQLDGNRKSVESFAFAIKEELRSRQRAYESVHADSYESYCRAGETGVATYRALPRLYILADDLDRALESDADGVLRWELQQVVLCAPHYGVRFLYSETKQNERLAIAYNSLP